MSDVETDHYHAVNASALSSLNFTRAIYFSTFETLDFFILFFSTARWFSKLIYDRLESFSVAVLVLTKLFFTNDKNKIVLGGHRIVLELNAACMAAVAALPDSCFLSPRVYPLITAFVPAHKVVYVCSISAQILW